MEEGAKGDRLVEALPSCSSCSSRCFGAKDEGGSTPEEEVMKKMSPKGEEDRLAASLQQNGESNTMEGAEEEERDGTQQHQQQEEEDVKSVEMADTRSAAEIDEERGFTDHDLQCCLKVLLAFQRNLPLLQQKRYKELRAAGLVFLEGVSKRYFKGMTPQEYNHNKARKAERKRRRKEEAKADIIRISKAKMRQQKLRRLEKLIEGEDDEVSLLSLPSSSSAKLLLTGGEGGSSSQQADDEAEELEEDRKRKQEDRDESRLLVPEGARERRSVWRASVDGVRKSNPKKKNKRKKKKRKTNSNRHGKKELSKKESEEQGREEEKTTEADEMEGEELKTRTDKATDKGKAKQRKKPLVQSDENADNEASSEADEVLSIPEECYMCKAMFYRLHHFYDRMCPACAQLNWKKRNQKADLTGRVALVTGARIKIGYETSLILLRCGAQVIATTRFPNDALLRYSKEKDFEEWKDRLHIYALDLRYLHVVEAFCDFMLSAYPRLDILINNAAQTIRRPPAFYSHLLSNESVPIESLPSDFQRILCPVSLLDGARPWGNHDMLDASPGSVPLALPSSCSSSSCSSSSCSSSSSSSSSSTVSFTVPTEKYVSTILLQGTSTSSLSSSPSTTCQVRIEEVDPNEEQDEALKQQEQNNGEHGTQLPEIILSNESDKTMEEEATADQQRNTNIEMSASAAPAASSTLPSISAMLSQVAVTNAEQNQRFRDKLFPPGRYDEHHQQLDLRRKNSWTMQADQVPIHELAEVHVINSLAPYILCNRLMPLLEKSPVSDRFIINVSSVEGQFYHRKTTSHPHTNMAKASMNMLTRTAAAYFAKRRIWMSSVDTGWISDMNPVQRSERIAKKYGTIFRNPIDEVDGAARILDPVFLRLNEGKVVFGKFWKDYSVAPW